MQMLWRNQWENSKKASASWPQMNCSCNCRQRAIYLPSPTTCCYVNEPASTNVYVRLLLACLLVYLPAAIVAEDRWQNQINNSDRIIHRPTKQKKKKMKNYLEKRPHPIYVTIIGGTWPLIRMQHLAESFDRQLRNCRFNYAAMLSIMMAALLSKKKAVSAAHLAIHSPLFFPPAIN